MKSVYDTSRFNGREPLGHQSSRYLTNHNNSASFPTVLRGHRPELHTPGNRLFMESPRQEQHGSPQISLGRS